MMSPRKHYLVLFMAIILVCSISYNVLAIDDMEALNAELNEQETKQTYTSGKIWVEFLKLLVVLGLIVLATWLVIRMFGRQMTNKMQGTWIQVVDEVTLGQNRGIVLCEVGEKLFAVGVTDHNINILFEIDNPKLLEDISLSQSTTETSASLDILEVKDYILNRFKGQKTPSNNQKFRNMMAEQFSRLEKLSEPNTKNDTKEEVMK